MISFLFYYITWECRGCHFEVKNHNVLCVNSNDEILWQIKLNKEPYKDADMECGDPFVNLKITEEGNLSARNFSGFEYIIDVDTGDTRLIAWHK